MKQVSQLAINQYASGQAIASSQPTQMTSVVFVQSSDQKGNQQPRRTMKKVNKNNRKGGNKKKNANYNDKNARNARGDKQSKRKVKFVSMTTSLTCSLIWKIAGHPICKLITTNIRSVQYLLSTQGSILFQG